MGVRADTHGDDCIMRHHVELIVPPTIVPPPIMPPTTLVQIKERVLDILYPLSGWAAREGPTTTDCLYDWLHFGGHFAGTKLYLRLDPERRRQFWDELDREAFDSDTHRIGQDRMWGIEGNVEDRDSSIDPGRLWSVRDIPAVDALWRKWFPEDKVGKFPLSPYYPEGKQDICRVDQIPEKLTAYAVVVANEDKELFQFRSEVFGEHTWRSTGFNGFVLDALRQCRACGVEPAPDWLAVTLTCYGG